MKPKEIPANIVVHTPTETEAKELLAILHEHGYKWSSDAALTGVSNFHVHNGDTCYCLEPPYVTFRPQNWFIRKGYTILTFAEFKERYCEEERPQPKFILGDIVKIVNVTNPMLVGETGIIMELPTKEDSRYKVGLEDEWILLDAKYLKLYTETEINEETTVEAKQLNLCELLKGCEGQSFYSPCYGDVDLIEVLNDRIIISSVANDKKHTLGKRGKHYAGFAECMCMLFPSRALYEQYPLDPIVAWTEWQELQTQILMSVTLGAMGDGNTIHKFYQFRTAANRDKCIQEIKAILKKYSVRYNDK